MKENKLHRKPLELSWDAGMQKKKGGWDEWEGRNSEGI